MKGIVSVIPRSEDLGVSISLQEGHSLNKFYGRRGKVPPVQLPLDTSPMLCGRGRRVLTRKDGVSWSAMRPSFCSLKDVC